jgi:hypothetical protein
VDNDIITPTFKVKRNYERWATARKKVVWI